MAGRLRAGPSGCLISPLTDGVCGGLVALLVLPVVAGDGTVRRLRLHRPPVRADQHRGHHTQRA